MIITNSRPGHSSLREPHPRPKTPPADIETLRQANAELETRLAAVTEHCRRCREGTPGARQLERSAI